MYRTLELRRSMLLHIQLKKLDSCSKFTMHASSKHLSHIDFNVDLYVRELKNIEMKKIDYNLFPSFPSLGDSHSRNFEKKKNSYEFHTLETLKRRKIPMNMTTPVAHPDFNVDLYARDFKYFFEMKKFDYNICFPR